jgi:hypothetical protein
MAQFVDPVEVHSTWVWVLVAPKGCAIRPGSQGEDHASDDHCDDRP